MACPVQFSSRRALWVLLVAAVAGTGACRIPARRGSGQGVDGLPIGSVSIAGNHAVDDDDIVAGLAHRPREGWVFRRWTFYDPLVGRIDRKRIVAYYRLRGYFAAEVTDVEAVVDGRRTNVTFAVREGEPARIVAVEVTGVDGELRDGELREVVDGVVAASNVRVGEVFEHPRYVELRQALRGALVARGHAHAEIEGRVEVDRRTQRVVVRLAIDPGPLVRFGEATVVGRTRVPVSAMRARLAWSPGDRYDPERVMKAQRRMAELGAFTSVRIDFATDGRPAVLDMRIRVAEGKPNELKLGGGTQFDPTQLQLHGRASYLRRGFLGPLVTLRGDAQPGYVILTGADVERELVFEGRLGVERMDLLAPRLRGSVEVTARREATEAYTSFGPGARLALDRPWFDDALRLSVAWNGLYLIDLQADDDVLGEKLGARAPYRLAYLEQNAVLDLRDDRLEPHRGAYAAVQLEEGGAYAGGAFDYLKSTVELRGYVPLMRRLVLAARGRVGWLDARGDEPITQRYFSGSSGHRGFGFRRLSPSLVDGTGNLQPVGGAALVETGAELRFQAGTLRTFPALLSLFLDGGDVTPTAGDLQLRRLHWAVGVGFQWVLPIGPLRLNLGYRLNRTAAMEADGTRNPDPGGHLAFHFSLGEAY